ncbi:MAG: hypothetical protein JNK72_12955 [Myxococcales bacterium]|nr:hypothetical protein [Myxococcales bacterium]
MTSTRRARTLSRAVAGALLWALGALSGCGDDRLADGSPCTSALQCGSRLCLDEGPGQRRCARRCSAQAGCGAGELCGRFDFRGRDDAGIPIGDLIDVAQVCRRPLNRRCSEGCEAGQVCVGGEGAEGVCATPCASAVTCGGRDCVTALGVASCLPPCDALDECGRAMSCDLARVDADGHGQCIYIGGPPVLRDGGAP